MMDWMADDGERMLEMRWLAGTSACREREREREREVRSF